MPTLTAMVVLGQMPAAGGGHAAPGDGGNTVTRGPDPGRNGPARRHRRAPGRIFYAKRARGRDGPKKGAEATSPLPPRYSWRFTGCRAYSSSFKWKLIGMTKTK